MSIKLATNEKMIKEYAYATTREGIINKRVTQNSLLVTNKRIIKTDICDKTGWEKKDVSEISVDAITGVRTKSSSSFKFIFLVIGIIVGIIGLVSFFSSFQQVTESVPVENEYEYEYGYGYQQEYEMVTTTKVQWGLIVLAVLLIGLAAVCIYKFIKSRKNVLLCDFVVADRVNTAMCLGAVSYNSLLSRFAISGKSRFIKIVVDGEIAKEFASEIGAILIDIKNGAIE